MKDPNLNILNAAKKAAGKFLRPLRIAPIEAKVGVFS
ncbi:hypothetical protein J2Z65_005558 [Paenibacillus aceris]|uniref:Uncharacterized protein n=1 Tax=Paenibacillus aceris TaxID=869555 RepID=A0ABS4I5V2_9BACL|nr:hypothetical protein [Paenibacillus aceris]